MEKHIQTKQLNNVETKKPNAILSTAVNDHALHTRLFTPDFPDKDTLISLFTGHIAVLQRELESITKRKPE